MPEAVHALAQRFLADHADRRPVDATFMGLPGHNHRLPSTDADAPADEAAALAWFAAELAACPPPTTSAGRIEHALLDSCLAETTLALEVRPRWSVPTFYTGEVAFGLISLLLPTAPPDAADALAARLQAVPVFLAGARHHLVAADPDWVTRTTREVAAIQRLLTEGLPLHPLWRPTLVRPRDEALSALAAFATTLAVLPPAPVAIGRAAVDTLLRRVHRLNLDADAAIAFGEAEFARQTAVLAQAARAIDPTRTAAEQLAALATQHPPLADIPACYPRWHERAMAGAAALVTPAAGYGLQFPVLPDWAAAAAPDLYFLSYRCPPAFAAGAGSTYWTARPSDSDAYRASQATVTIKQTHAVHHGSIGHHTQNARARAAGSVLAQVAGTDAAAGIAFLAAGTMVEGWSCYVMTLMDEVADFYTPAERLALIQSERRNAASIIADLKLHTGQWSLAEMRRFYQDEAGFPAARVWSETTRNALFPTSRAMYYLGTDAVWRARSAWTGSTRSFHDGLIGAGHVPITLAIQELQATSGAPSATRVA